jgi:hypothetical protein
MLEERSEKYDSVYSVIDNALWGNKLVEIDLLFSEDNVKKLSLETLLAMIAYTSVARNELKKRDNFKALVRDRFVKERGVDETKRSIDCIV